MERYRKLKVIGKGSFGFAVLVQSVSDRQTYVMKIIDASKMDRKQREDAINEVHVLKAMRHPYIITYKESFMDKRCLCIVMDYADGGDLYTKIANQTKPGFSQQFPMNSPFRQIKKKAKFLQLRKKRLHKRPIGKCTWTHDSCLFSVYRSKNKKLTMDVLSSCQCSTF